MASFLSVGLLLFSILVITDCSPNSGYHHGHHGHHGSEEVDFFNQEGPIPIPGRKGLLNFILLVPQRKKEAFCKGYLNAIDHNRNVDIDYGFGYGPGIEIHESGSSSSSSGSHSSERSDIINIPGLPNTQLINGESGWLLAQGAGDGKNANGGKQLFPVSLERYCRMFLVSTFL